MILDSDNDIIQRGDVAVLQMKALEKTADMLKTMAEMNYVTRVSETVYDVNKERTICVLDYFFVKRYAPIFKVDEQFYPTTDTVHVLQWLENRVRHYNEKISLEKYEIIKFILS